MYCTGCGAELKEGARFCEKCGKPVNNAWTGSQIEHPEELLPISLSRQSVTNQQDRKNKEDKNNSKSRRARKFLLVLLVMLLMSVNISVVVFLLNESGMLEIGSYMFSDTVGYTINADNGTEIIQNTQSTYKTEGSHNEEDNVLDMSGEWVDTNSDTTNVSTDFSENIIWEQSFAESKDEQNMLNQYENESLDVHPIDQDGTSEWAKMKRVQTQSKKSGVW